MALSYGSKGDEVKKLQRALNEKGYALDVDGIYGSQTQSAVKDYQKKNNLSVDGIVGNQTWGSLSAPTQTKPQAMSPPMPQQSIAAVQAVKRPEYVQGNEVKNAGEAVENWEKNKPNEYKGTYQEQIDTLLDRILNGEKFSYDVNADALYQQYKDKYIKQGQQAMQDTMGQAAALTGGYGSSYATTAGSQAYQGYLERLNDIVPQLQEAAYNRYLQEENANRQNLSTVQSADAADYAKYRDLVGDYWTEGNYLATKQGNLSQEDWNKYLQSVSNYENDRAFRFNQEQFDYQKAQDALSQKNWEKEFALAQAAKASSGRSGSSSRSSSRSSSSSGAKYSNKAISNMAKSGNISGVMQALEGQADSPEDLINLMTAYGVDIDEARHTVEKAYLPQSYKEFVDLTGQSGILTESEFKRRSTYKSKYGSYQNYLKEMLNQYL